MNLASSLRCKVSLTSIVNNFQRDRTMLIHHGLMGSAKNFRGIAKNVCLSSYVNSHLIDARNHGDSPHQDRFDLDCLADDIEEYIEERLSSEKRLILMGHSLGGLVLLNLIQKCKKKAVRAKVERVVVIDIPISPLKHRNTFTKTGEMLRNLVTIDMNQTVPQIYKLVQTYAISPSVASLIETDVLPGGKWRTNLKSISKNYSNIGQFHFTGSEWKLPIDLIYGSESEYLSAEELNKYRVAFPQMKESNVYRVAKAGHWVHVENTQAFLEAVKHILTKND